MIILERMKIMNINKERALIFGLTLTTLGAGFGWYHSTHSMSETNQKQQTEIVKLQQNLDKTKAQEENYKEKVEIAVQNNTNPSTKQNSDMYQTIRKVFETFYNFDPDNYTTRESQIKDELSKKMREQLFPQNVSNYQGKLYSKANAIEVYSNVYYTKAGNKTALVLVDYETHYKGEKNVKQQAIWKVSYNVEDKQITKIEQTGEDGQS